MKVIALGVHSAFATGELAFLPDGTDVYVPKWHSNFLLEFDSPGKVRDDVYRLAIDFGGDIRHSLAMAGLKMTDIDGWYCSHPHNDHIGGTEGIALSTFFHPAWTKDKKMVLSGRKPQDFIVSQGDLPDRCKPDLYGHREVLKRLWQAAVPGLNTIQGVDTTRIQIFFHAIPMGAGVRHRIKDGEREWTFYAIESMHVVAGMEHMPSFGLMFESSDGKRIYFPTDTLLMMPPTMESFYRMADVVYQDCETGHRSGVHSHIEDVVKVDPEIKKKCYLYHYTTEPDVSPGEFAGVMHRGDIHEY